MNLITTRMRRETCPTCQQPVVPPTPSKVIAVRVGMACFAVASGLLEYRRAVRRELEQRRLEQLHDTSPDVPLDEHLDQRETFAGDERRDPPVASAPIIDEFAAEGVTATPWPPSHPSLAADDDTSGAES